METVAWVIAIELAVGLVAVAYFALQVSLLNARIMYAVTNQWGELLKQNARQSELIATVRVGDIPVQVAAPTAPPYAGAWIPEDRPVGSA